MDIIIPNLFICVYICPLKNNLNSFFVKKEENDVLKILAGDSEYGELSKILEVLRLPLFKLSETNLNKAIFNLWKREGLIEKLIIKTEEKVWHMFSSMELVILYVVNILWSRKIEDKIIKDVIDKMLDDKYVEKLDSIYWYWNISEHLALEQGKDPKEALALLKPKLDLLMYLNRQQEQNPHLPIITRIEALIIGAIRTNRPYSIILFDNDKIEFFQTDAYTDEYKRNIIDDLLKQSFINISIGDIVSSILSEGNSNTKSINTLISDSNIIIKLIEKGYDINTLNEIFKKKNDLIYQEEKLDPKQNIGKLLSEKVNQDIIIKSREGKVQSIRRKELTKKQ